MHQDQNPNAKIISLGVGDTTEPIPEFVGIQMSEYAKNLSTREGYSGYGPDHGWPELRKAIAKAIYQNMVEPDDIFVSDGSKCDITRLQILFGKDCTVSVQNPSYPVYVDTSIMFGMTGQQSYDGLQYLECKPENDFFPDLSKVKRTDIIYFCSPNNPTGASATRQQLQQLVDFALANGSIIVYDSAYAPFIQDENVPKSIFEIPGAKKCAIETTSFSKYAGFTGVRLGWTVVSNELLYANGHPVKADFSRVMSTCFNGASSVAQAGGIACLKPQGYDGMKQLVNHYLGNAEILTSTFEKMGFKVYGGKNAPYIWVSFPGKQSWDAFQDILNKTDVVTTPGVGFGNAGEGFIRVSAFGSSQSYLFVRMDTVDSDFREKIIGECRGSLQAFLGGFLCSDEDNIYDITFIDFIMRNCDTGKVVLQATKDFLSEDKQYEMYEHEQQVRQVFKSEDLDSQRSVFYQLPESLLNSKAIGTTILFSLGEKELKNFRMIEKHFIKDELVESFDFDFGFGIPNSVNTVEAVYEFPQRAKDLLKKNQELQQLGHRADSFYFSGDDLIMHHKAFFKYKP